MHVSKLSIGLVATLILLSVPHGNALGLLLALGDNGFPLVAALFPPALHLLGLPALAGLKLLAPLKLGLLSKAGLVTGTIGTVLGGTALKLLSENKRRKRSVSEPETDEIFLDESEIMEMIEEPSDSQCAQRLVCELAMSSAKGYEKDELAILDFIRSASKTRQKHRKGLLQYEKAYLLGQSGYHCQSIYSSCPYPASTLVPLIKQLEEEYMKYYPQYIRSILNYH